MCSVLPPFSIFGVQSTFHQNEDSQMMSTRAELLPFLPQHESFLPLQSTSIFTGSFFGSSDWGFSEQDFLGFEQEDSTELDNSSDFSFCVDSPGVTSDSDRDGFSSSEGLSDDGSSVAETVMQGILSMECETTLQRSTAPKYITLEVPHDIATNSNNCNIIGDININREHFITSDISVTSNDFNLNGHHNRVDENTQTERLSVPSPSSSTVKETMKLKATTLCQDDKKLGRPPRNALSPNQPDSKPDKKVHRPKVKKTIHLWEFLEEILDNKSYSPKFIAWVSRHAGTFRLVDSKAVAKLWGERKNRRDMTYEKMSRAMRYYYERKIIKHVEGQKLNYQFGDEINERRQRKESTEGPEGVENSQ